MTKIALYLAIFAKATFRHLATVTLKYPGGDSKGARGTAQDPTFYAYGIHNSDHVGVIANGYWIYFIDLLTIWHISIQFEGKGIYRIVFISAPADALTKNPLSDVTAGPFSQNLW